MSVRQGITEVNVCRATVNLASVTMVAMVRVHVSATPVTRGLRANCARLVSREIDAYAGTLDLRATLVHPDTLGRLVIRVM